MPASLKFLPTLSAPKSLVVIFWVFVTVIISLLGLTYLTIENLSAARAYVGGEGLWSKAQKQAVYDLLRYSISHSEQDYRDYQRSLLVPLGDRDARLELEKGTPNMSVVQKGFIQGRNSPDDVNGMTTFFLRFRHSRSMSEAIAIWTEGDTYIEQLVEVGDNLHKEISSGNPNPARVAEIAKQVDLIGSELTPLEDRFSYALGAGARQTKAAFLLVTFAAAALSLLVGALFTFFMVRHVRQLDQRYKHLIDTANDLILVIDGETGTIVDANIRSSELLARPVKEIVGIRGGDIVAVESRRQYREMIDATLAGKPVTGMELRLKHGQGESRAFEVNTSLTEFEGKKIVQGIFRDIAERRRLEEEVRQAQKMEVVGRLAGGIAHDFNNLLMVILTQVSKLRKLSRPELVSQCTEIIQTAAERAESLTKELLAFGRKQMLVLQVVDLNELVSEVEKMIVAIPAQQVQVAMVSSLQPLPVEIDPGKIEQVIMNLAVNAYDAMPSGGVLTIKTSRVFRSDPVTGISSTYAALQLTDTGTGMDEITKSHLFEPFFTTKPPGKGTGLGLSTVFGIVNQSGGSVEVESAVGRGTTVKVYLPIVDRPISPRKIPALVSPAVIRGSETVLLVEDQSPIRDVLYEFLQSEGYQVLKTSDGNDALTTAASHSGAIDVLVTDVIMPHMRGLELAKRITELRPGIHVVFMSGYSEDVLLDNRLLQTSKTFIQKPFEPEDLARTIRESLSEKYKQS